MWPSSQRCSHIELPKPHSVFVSSTETMLPRFSIFRQLATLPFCSMKLIPRGHSLYTTSPTLLLQRSPLHEARSVKQTAYGIPQSALWSHLVWLLFLQLVINKHKLRRQGAAMVDIHTLTAHMLLYRDYRLPGKRNTQRGHTGLCEGHTTTYSQLQATHQQAKNKTTDSCTS